MPFFANCWIVALIIRLVKGGKLYMIKDHAFVRFESGRVLHFTPRFESDVLAFVERWTRLPLPLFWKRLDEWPMLLFFGKVDEMPERKVRLLFKLASPRLIF